MWRRVIASQIQTTLRSAPTRTRPPLRPRHFATQSGNGPNKTVADATGGIATGHELEEMEAERQGKRILEIDYPEGPFGTKEAPAVVKSYFNSRIVGCPGGEGEDEHDVVWFWLEKGKPHVCPICEQYFVLEVDGPGGPAPHGPEIDTDDEGHHDDEGHQG